VGAFRWKPLFIFAGLDSKLRALLEWLERGVYRQCKWVSEVRVKGRCGQVGVSVVGVGIIGLGMLGEEVSLGDEDAGSIFKGS
jgi:hypothetical protein